MSENILEIRHLGKSFGTHEVLRDIDFTVKKGDVISIIGASGSGKSTLLRCVNLLETPSSGQILYHGTDVAGRGVNAPEYRSHVGMVFQSFNLFNNMSVLKNCMVGQMKVLKRSKEEARQQALKYLEKVGMAPYINAKPRQISGGQKQRVAIARALANDPKVLLCDEATSALDPKTTRSILKLLREVNQRLGITIVVITHQMSVVKYICDRAAVMEKGRVVEEGTILEIFSHPKMPVTKGFIDTATNVDDLYELLEETRSGDGVNHGQTVYLLTYTGSSAGKPLMVELYQRFGVEANIIFGNVELLKGTPLGKHAVTLSGTPESVGDALEFIRSQNVVVEAL